MKKRFKAKRKKKFLLLIYLILSFIIVYISFNILKKIDSRKIINNQIYSINYKFDRNKFLLKSALNYTYIDKIILPTFEEVENIKVVKTIYVYNTHQTESYDKYTVVDAANYLKDVLKNYNINVIVEDTNIKSEMNKMGYTYSQSYRVTKELLGKYLDKDISLFIDLHRDSSNKSITTYEDNGVSYARMMFVVGGNHDNYLNNYQTAEELNRFVKNINSSLSRGIMLKKTSNYNQELNSNIILLELGGPYNTREEINNSIDCLAKAINDYLSE